MGRNCDIINFILKYLILSRSRVAIFADIIKIVTMFLKKKAQKTLKELEIKYQNAIFICILHIAEFVVFQ